MEAIMAICLPILIQKPVFTMPIKDRAPVEVRQVPQAQQVVLEPYTEPTPAVVDSAAQPQPEGVPLITICRKDDLGNWVIETIPLYSGNYKYEPWGDSYEYTGSCPDNLRSKI